jgi:hypothetical protein
VAIPGATASTLVISQSGLYSVTVTNSNGCSRNSTNFNPSFASIAENGFLPVQIFPNPTTGLIKISSDQPVNRIEIHSINGSKMGDFYSDQLDLSTYSSGIYFAKIFCDSRTEILRIQKN